jgi:hypothetical protein
METLNLLFANSLHLAKIEVGDHLYWEIGNLKVHGQVLLTSWFVIALLVIASVLATRNIQRVPAGMQNFMEYALEFVRDLAKKPTGRKRISPLGTIYRYFIFVHLRVKLVGGVDALETDPFARRGTGGSNKRYQYDGGAGVADISGIFLRGFSQEGPGLLC